jgi:hypothetical protein
LGEQICHELPEECQLCFVGKRVCSWVLPPSLSKCNTATNISINIDTR